MLKECENVTATKNTQTAPFEDKVSFKTAFYFKSQVQNFQEKYLFEILVSISFKCIGLQFVSMEKYLSLVEVSVNYCQCTINLQSIGELILIFSFFLHSLAWLMSFRNYLLIYAQVQRLTTFSLNGLYSLLSNVVTTS